MILRALALLFLTGLTASLNATPLVDADWLNEHLKDDNLVVLVDIEF